MPDVTTQVYWHDIPGAQAPWQDEQEYARMWVISSKIKGLVSDRSHLLQPLRKEVLQMRARIRRKPPPSDRFWGIVLEPYLSPLLGLNMIMKELQVPGVTYEEAAAAVSVVEEEYNLLTQQFGTQQGSQWSEYEANVTQRSTVSRRNATPAMDVKEAPLLEVVKILCADRKLIVTPLSKEELRRKGRISFSDLVSHKRVVIAFDRSKPHFAFALGVVVKKKAEAVGQVRCMQLVAPTANPTPWRRLVKVGMERLSANDCVVVVVQRQDDCSQGKGLQSDHENEDDDVQLNDGEGGEPLPRIPHKRPREEGNERDGESGRSVAMSESSESVSEGGDEERNYDKIRFGRNPIFTEKDYIQDDPLFRTPVAILRKNKRVAGEVHDWIQRLVRNKERNKLFAINI
ncbi:hypothetical protein ERJ75_001727100 [Trypanosoma vivax]|uniref:Uncharacterized protein n=1 Tax=Trypanosoma vivax (strain Y486) TaxID=1055687 RepID=G0U3B9_TRYVY|nr:hypothetical protein TRVL_03508 [Trypanosoma vivax]KAH8604116.1 hypothetical protein ERJ75_001727100 [Trypanosoma vivax]CCC50775.1 conserved hypothetical protein [Trypanosoma vivax Y486]